MTFPVVEGRASTAIGTAQNSHTINLPSGIVSGEQLVMIFAHRTIGDLDAIPAGWTELADIDDSAVRAWIMTRTADGTEGSTVTVNEFGASTLTAVAHVFRISGVSGNVEVASWAQGGFGNEPDPPSLTPTWGSKDTCWIACGAAGDDDRTWDDADADYLSTLLSTISGGGADNGVSIGSAYDFVAAATENPGIFTLSANNRAVALTIAVEPDSAADTTAPTYGTAPAIDTAASLTVTADATASDETDASVDHYAVILPDGAAAPSAAQVKAGTDGNDAAAVDAGSSLAVSNGVEASIQFTGLSASTAYDVYWMVEDSSGNQNLAAKLDTTTAAADSTAPTYGVAPAIDATTDTTITADATATDETDSEVDHYAVIIADGGPAPSAAQVKAGTDGNGDPAVDSGSDLAVANGVEASIQFTGLSESTAYDVYWMVEDASGNQNLATKVDTTTSSTAPTLTTPTGTETGDTTADGSVSTNEGNGTLYWIVDQSATPPSVAQIQAGNDQGGVAADASGNESVSATGAQNVSATGLAAGTTYYFYFQHQDAAGNDSAVVSSVSFTTNSSANLVFSALKDQDGQLVPDSTTINYQWWPDSAGTGTQDFDNLNATVEAGSQATSGAGSLTLTGLTTGGGLLALQWTRAGDSKIHRHVGRYTVS